MILHPIASKLTNVFMRYCKDPQGAAKEAEPIIQELYDSLSGCDDCFGAGYIIMGDIYDYCRCKRGKSLSKFVENR